jgi:hypothetical protein
MCATVSSRSLRDGGLRPRYAVIVDDMHFADDASLEMRTVLTHGFGDPGVLLWGFARRPAEGSPALMALVDALLEERPRREAHADRAVERRAPRRAARVAGACRSAGRRREGG